MSIEYDYRLAREDVAPRNTYQVPSFTEYNGIPVDLYSFFDDTVFIENTRSGQAGVLTELITVIPVSFDVMYGKNYFAGDLFCRCTYNTNNHNSTYEYKYAQKSDDVKIPEHRYYGQINPPYFIQATNDTGTTLSESDYEQLLVRIITQKIDLDCRRNLLTGRKVTNLILQYLVNNR